MERHIHPRRPPRRWAPLAALVAVAMVPPAAARDECIEGTAICNSGSGPQVCVDPDRSTEGTWLCVCTNDALRVAPQRAAECAEVGNETNNSSLPPLPGRAMPLPPAVDVEMDAPIDLPPFRSDAVNTLGHELLFTNAPPVAYTEAYRGRALPVTVLGPFAADPDFTAAGAPLLVVRSSVNASDAATGVAATAAAHPGQFITAFMWNATTMDVFLRHPSFAIHEPMMEVLTISVSPRLFAGGDAGAACAGSGGTTAACTYRVELLPETPRLPSHAELIRETGVSAVVMGALSFIGPGGTTVGPNTGVLALTTRAMFCPIARGETPPLDLTLNPLGLRLGGSRSADFSGAVIGVVILIALVSLVTAVAAGIIAKRIKPLIELDRQVDGAARNGRSTSIDIRFILMQARAGRLYIPFGFIFPSAVFGSLGAVAYSEWYFKLLGIVVLLCIIAGVATTCLAARAAPHWCHYQPVEYAPTLSARVFWGDHHWVPRPELRGSLIWRSLHRLTFGAWRPLCRHYLTAHLTYVFVMAAVSVWEPRTRNECSGRILLMVIGVACVTVSLAATRPYIAPYANVLALCTSTLLTSALICALVAMGSPNPSRHAALVAAAGIVRGAMWVNITKFVCDMCVFVADEYEEWRRASGGGKASCAFLKHLFVFKDATSSWAHYQQRDKDIVRELHRKGSVRSLGSSLSSRSHVTSRQESFSEAVRVDAFRMSDADTGAPLLGNSHNTNVADAPPAVSVGADRERTPGSTPSPPPGTQSSPRRPRPQQLTPLPLSMAPSQVLGGSQGVASPLSVSQRPRVAKTFYLDSDLPAMPTTPLGAVVSPHMRTSEATGSDGAPPPPPPPSPPPKFAGGGKRGLSLRSRRQIGQGLWGSWESRAAPTPSEFDDGGETNSSCRELLLGSPMVASIAGGGEGLRSPLLLDISVASTDPHTATPGGRGGGDALRPSPCSPSLREADEALLSRPRTPHRRGPFAFEDAGGLSRSPRHNVLSSMRSPSGRGKRVVTASMRPLSRGAAPPGGVGADAIRPPQRQGSAQLQADSLQTRFQRV